MPRPEEDLITLLKKHGIDFTASLPCEKIKTLLEMVGRDFPHVALTREEEGAGICAGAALAGKRPAMFVQSSGVGNMINALLSLTGFYQLPLALFVSRRGIYKEKIAAQMPMGERLPSILAGAGIMFSKLNNRNDIGTVDRELQELFNRNTIHAFLLSPEVWEGSECGMQNADAGKMDEGTGREGVSEMKYIESPCLRVPASPRLPLSRATLTRYDIIGIIAPYLEGKVVVSNLGWPSKELYALKHQPSNFYMLGSMGMATPIGLGIALTSSKEVVVIDGDGSLLMNPGTLATAAASAPKNLTVVAIDNGAYGSTGNQPTLTGNCVDLEEVARGLGFRNTVKAANKEEIIDAMMKPREGLAFIHVLALPGNKDVPNIPIHHLEIRKQVQGFLKNTGS